MNTTIYFLLLACFAIPAANAADYIELVEKKTEPHNRYWHTSSGSSLVISGSAGGIKITGKGFSIQQIWLIDGASLSFRTIDGTIVSSAIKSDKYTICFFNNEKTGKWYVLNDNTLIFALSEDENGFYVPLTKEEFMMADKELKKSFEDNPLSDTYRSPPSQPAPPGTP